MLSTVNTEAYTPVSERRPAFHDWCLGLDQKDRGNARRGFARQVSFRICSRIHVVTNIHADVKQNRDRINARRKTTFRCKLHVQDCLPPFPDHEADGRHWHNFHVPHGETGVEASPAITPPHVQHSLSPAYPASRSYEPPNLHPPSDDLERI